MRCFTAMSNDADSEVGESPTPKGGCRKAKINHYKEVLMAQKGFSVRLTVALVLSLFVFSSSAFAAVPQVAQDYINVFIDLTKGQAGMIFIVTILGFSAYLAWRNGNLVPLLWGLAAAVLLGGAPYIAPKLLNFGQTAFG